MPAVNYKNSNYFYISNDFVTVPSSSSGTGTIATSGITVIGTGTKFMTEMPKGSWVIDFATSEMRMVDRVDTDTRAYLVQGFSVDLAPATALDLIHSKDCNAVAISVKVPSSAATDILVDDQTFPKGEAMTFSKDSRDRSSKKDLVDPIFVDATGSAAMILIME